MVPGAIVGLDLGNVSGKPLLTGYVAPPEIPQQAPGLLAWFDGTHPETFTLDPSGGTRVNAWASRVGTYTLTQYNVSQMPQLSGIGQYGNGLYFDGQDDNLICNELAAPMSGNVQRFSWYIVIQMGALDGNRVLMSAVGIHNGHETYWHFLENGGSIGFISAMDNGYNAGGIGGYTPSNVPLVQSFLYRGDAGFVRTNHDGEFFGAAGGSQFTAEYFRICAAANGSACSNAIVTECIVYNAYHEDDQRIAIVNYLRAKYGI